MPTRGGQTGNSNARRAKYPRLAPSFSGEALELAYTWLAELGENQPTPERAKHFIVEKFVEAAKERK
jgi:hypothetical protein